MNERFIYLLEKYFENGLSAEEESEFNSLLNSSKILKGEFEEQKKVKEVLNKMQLKNPSKEFWDGYWMNIYNRFERGAAWIAITIGAIIFFGFAAYEAVKSFIIDTQTPGLLKFGIGIMIFGLLVLVFSIIREKFSVYKKDKYKEIQR